jgi:hypothetical protein
MIYVSSHRSPINSRKTDIATYIDVICLLSSGCSANRFWWAWCNPSTSILFGMYFSPATFLDSRYLRNLRSCRTGYRALRFREQERVSRALQSENTKDIVAVLLRVIEIIQVTIPAFARSIAAINPRSAAGA